MNNFTNSPNHEGKVLHFMVEGNLFETGQQFITGAQVKELAGIPLDNNLYLYIREPYNDEIIENNQKIDLSLPGIEGFFTKKPLLFTVDSRHFSTRKQFITGADIREMAKLPDDKELYLDVPEGWQDTLIDEDQKIDLARPGIEKFITLDSKVIVYVNSTPYEYNEHKITFDQVVEFAKMAKSSTTGFIVKYSHGPIENPKGIMSPETVVIVRNKMIFNVASTHRS